MQNIQLRYTIDNYKNSPIFLTDMYADAAELYLSVV